MSYDPYFAGQGSQFAYDPGRNHVWLLANGQPWDAAWGMMPRTYTNMYPRYVYNSYDEMAREIDMMTRGKELV